MTRDVSVEMFPVRQGSLKRLFAYRLDLPGGDLSTVGGKLSYRARKMHGGHWAWTTGRLLTDSPPENATFGEILDDLWKSQPDTFRGLRQILPDSMWTPSPRAIADFVARGLAPDLEGNARRILGEKKVDLGAATVERVHEIRGWEAAGKPAISISIQSHLIYKEDLKAYAERVGNPNELIGLWVAEKASSMKGEIVRFAGVIAEHRKRLLSLTQRTEMQELIQEAPDGEPVLTVQSGREEYDYPASALGVIVRSRDYRRFRINGPTALKYLKIEPGLRRSLVSAIADLAKRAGWVADNYRSSTNRGMFTTAEDSGFEPRLRFGGGYVATPDQRGLFNQIRTHGIYRKSDRFANSPIRIGILNALRKGGFQTLWTRLDSEAAKLGFKLRIAGEEDVRSLARGDMEKGIDLLMQERADLVLALIPDESEDGGDEWGAYHDFKSLTVGRGIPSQVVNASTIEKPYVVGNILLGILGKTGNIPFVLAEPLAYADFVVGIDIARERKKRLPGSISATAIARIYFGDGQFVRYTIHDAPLEGETIPRNVLQGLLPRSEFQEKRVVIHRDGYFRGDEQETLRSWAREIGAKFHLIEVIKSGTPRVFSQENGRAILPPKGTAFLLSDREAFLVSSPPPFADATPQPLHLRTDGTLQMKSAIHSILSLTLLHYGSLVPPKLPVTIHYSDRIAYLALRGIKPRQLEGTLPFWL